MQSNLKVTWMLLIAACRCAFALNAIHESSYNLLPTTNYTTNTTLSVGGIVSSQDNSVYQIPFSVALQATPKVELGAGIKTQWGGHADDHVPYLVFGVKYLTVRHTSFQADLLIGANIDAGKGFSLAADHRFGYTSNFYGRLDARLGFMEALVNNDALMSMECAYYPTLDVGRALSLELGLIASSQTRNFDGNLAMDIQPALQVHLGRESKVVTAVTIGLAGDHQEDLRVKVVLVYGF